MTWRVDTKGVIVGGTLAVALTFVIGAVREEPAGRIGRFQVAVGTGAAYVVDTATGRVWQRGQMGFLEPKLPVEIEAKTAIETEATAAPRAARDFIGKWVQRHPTEGQISMQIQPGGTVVLTEGQRSWEAQWRMDGDRIVITTDDATVTAQINAEGQLLVSAEGGPPLILKRTE